MRRAKNTTGLLVGITGRNIPRGAACATAGGGGRVAAAPVPGVRAIVVHRAGAALHDQWAREAVRSQGGRREVESPSCEFLEDTRSIVWATICARF